MEPAWYEIARTPDIVAYLDTARVDRISERARRVWFRFVYTLPMQIGDDTTARFKATEAREEIDCDLEQAKDLELRMETVSGLTTGAPTPDLNWKTFEEHPLGSGVFLVACRATGAMVRRPRGA
jgi:hypothetical protein